MPLGYNALGYRGEELIVPLTPKQVASLATDHSLDLPPIALIGPSPDDPNLMQVCAWCPTCQDAEVWCEARGYKVSHGICPQCAPVLLATDL